MHTVENLGEGVAQFFANIPGGVNAFLDKMARGSPLLVFCIFINKFLENFPSPLNPCVHVWSAPCCELLFVGFVIILTYLYF